MPTEAASFHDKYQLLGEISRGGMGVVYKALDIQLQRLVAIKVILQQHTELETIQRFQREAQALASVRHAHIVPVYDFGWHQQQPFLVMAYLEGQSLDSFVRERLKSDGLLPEWPTLLSLLSPIAEALELCHERGIVHRDLKPSNILLDKDSGRAMLLDFGLAKFLAQPSLAESLQSPLTKTGELVGTPDFMAPEQMVTDGEFGEIGPSTDVWALGATLYFSLSGQKPFTGGSPLAQLKAVTSDKPKPITEFKPNSPPSLDELFAQCFQKHSGQRLSMTELGQALRAPETLAPTRARRGVLWAGFSLFALCALLLFTFAWQKPVLRWRVPPPALSQHSSFELAVELQGFGATVWVSIDDSRFRPWKPLTDGYRRELKVPDGRREIRVRATNLFGRDSEELSAEVVVDSQAPVLRVLNKPEASRAKAVLLKLRASEPLTLSFEHGPVFHLKAGEQSVSVDCASWGRHVLRARGEDGVGHSCQVEVSVERLKSYVIGEEPVDERRVIRRFQSIEQALKQIPKRKPAHVLIAMRRLMLADALGLPCDRDVIFEGLRLDGERPLVVVPQYNQIEQLGHRLVFRQLIFTKTKAPVIDSSHPPPLLVARKGRLVLTDCEFAMNGSRTAIVLHDKPHKSVELLMERCVIRDTQHRGIDCRSPSRITLRQCQFRNTGDCAIHFKGVRQGQLVLEDCLFSSGDRALELYQGQLIQLKNCQFEDYSWGLHFQNMKTVSLTAVTVRKIKLRSSSKEKGPGVVALNFEGCRQTELRGLSIDDVFGLAMNVRIGHFRMRDSRVRNCRDSALGSQYTALRFAVGRARVRGCAFQDIPGAAITATEGARVKVLECQFEAVKTPTRAQGGQILD